MSTRYVWGKYSVNYLWKEKTTENIREFLFEGAVFISYSYELDEAKGLYKLTGNITTISDTGGGGPGKYAISATSPDSAKSSRILYEGVGVSGSKWKVENYSSGGRYPVHFGPSTGMNGKMTKHELVSTPQKGTLQGYVSSANSGQYPSDGASGNSWYTKQGQDNIDAASVSIPSTIMGGTQITITVTPGTGKVYAGTVSYIYQVKLGSGSWTTIATTTATTRTYTVPYGTESIQVRVQAKDDIGFTSSDYATSSAVTVINNQPPTAPGSIEVTNVVSGQQCTITLTAATDPDGTVESYIYERSVDGSAWQQIANVNALTYNDTINAEWGTVAYRAKAVDDDGDSGPYVTSQTSVVNSGWVIISGPANDMGDKPAPFDFEISVSISGQETSDNITVDITLDGQSVYSQAVAPNTPISIDVDTRTMRTGSHSFAVAATCDTYVPASGEYTFTVPEITIPDGGRMDQLEGQDGNVIFPITLARAVAGLENYGVESKVHPGAYTGTGTFGTDNPNSLEFEFEPKMVLIQGTAGRVAILIKPSGVGVSIGPNESTTLNVAWQGKTVSWYNALNAANQMNTENETYSYTAFG